MRLAKHKITVSSGQKTFSQHQTTLKSYISTLKSYKNPKNIFFFALQRENTYICNVNLKKATK